MTDRWDAFLSYASEDREQLAAPLYELLTTLGLKIWFDQTELRVGDSLRERIDAGLSRSARGIVILSPSFFAKHYPQRELNGLAQREVDGESIILPVWHNVDVAEVRSYSPPLADRVAAKSLDGLEAVAATLLLAIRPHYAQELQEAAKLIRPLPEITTGRELFDLMANAHGTKLYDDPVTTEAEAELIGGFRTTMSEIADFAEDIDHTEQLRWQLNLNNEIKELNNAGWRVFGTRSYERYNERLPKSELDLAVVALLKGARLAARVDGKLIVAREKAATPNEKADPSLG